MNRHIERHDAKAMIADFQALGSDLEAIRVGAQLRLDDPEAFDPLFAASRITTMIGRLTDLCWELIAITQEPM